MTTSSDRASERAGLRQSIPPLREWARTFVVGLFMGTADGVPGVSGGTIALIAGIYERLIDAITAVTPERLIRFLRALTPLDGGFSLSKAVAVVEEVDGWFLVGLVAGVGTAVVIVGQVVEYADREAPVIMFACFFGLIAASAIILLREVGVSTLPQAVAMAAGIIIAFVASGHSSALTGGGGLLVVFVAGALAVSAMIMPGLSGSLILVIIGQYTRMYDTLNEFLRGIVDAVGGASLATLTGPGTEVVVFIVGGLVGLFTISRIIRRALDANREVTYAFLVALVIGALRAPISTLNGPDYAVTWDAATIQTFAAFALVVAALVFVLDWYAVDMDLDEV